MFSPNVVSDNVNLSLNILPKGMSSLSTLTFTLAHQMANE